MSVRVQKMVPVSVGHRVVHSQATIDGPERYRSGDADDRDVLAIGAADTVDRGERADAVRHEQRTEAVQPRITVRRIRRVQLTACANPFQRAGVLELLQQFKIVVAGNAEQVPDARLLETAKQEVADLHS